MVKNIFIILTTFLLLVPGIAAEEKVDSLFQEAYLMIREADQLRYQGKNQNSSEKYRAALTKLDEISLENPDWNREGVKRTADYCASFLWERLPDIDGKGKGLEGKKLSVSFIDVGQGDSAFIQCPEGQNILIDGGEDKASTKVVDYLKSRGIYIINLVIATHPDADHIGGLPEIIKNFAPFLRS